MGAEATMRRSMASFQAMGRAKPGAIQVVNLVGPMWVRSSWCLGQW